MLSAITRKISPSFNQCELTHLKRQSIDIKRAEEQHEEYERVLQSLGVRVVSLPAERTLPDSVFVEDAAVVLDEIAVITRPGAESRRRETDSIEKALIPFRKTTRIQPPGTLDGGDVLVIDKKIYIGLSARSNIEGIQQMHSLLNRFGYKVMGVEIHGCLHLKSAVTRVSEQILLINPKWIDEGNFTGLQFIQIDEIEPYAANGLQIENKLIFSDAFPKTLEKLIAAGIEVIPIDVSEIAKAEGAITCCSLLFKS